MKINTRTFRYRTNLLFSSNSPVFRKKKLPFLPIAILIPLLLFGGNIEARADQNPFGKSMEVGVAQIDITPEGPIRLSGYGSRKTESDGVLQKLNAKALAFGSDAQGPSILITVDLIGVTGHITEQLADRLSKKTGLDPDRLVICASHTHSGPEVGTLLNHFHAPLPADQLARIALYIDQLIPKLEEVTIAALRDRSPALVSWGQGQAGFAMNRRIMENGNWVGFGAVPEGPVDHSMPLLSIKDLNGKLRSVLVNYACHGTTLGGDINQTHGDWMGEAQRLIESNHPDAIAMVAIGCGADADPQPRRKIEHTTLHGKEIADEVERLLASSLHPITIPPVGRRKNVELPYADIPTIEELAEQTKEKAAKGYYARVALDRFSRGEAIPSSLTYPVQTWTFGDDLAMVFLAGEVVVDYSLRLKDELGADRLWISAYANDVPGYIASRRVIREGGYEAESSMYSYDQPSPYKEEVEDIIIEAVYDLLPKSFKKKAIKKAKRQSRN